MKRFTKSSIALIVVGLVVAGGISAALVSYISNATTATVGVSSPVVMSVYEGEKDGDKIGTESIDLTSNGGSSMPFTTTATNNANNRIGGYYVMVMEATDENDLMTGKEFTSMMYTINESGYTGENGELISMGKLCVVRGNGSLTKLAEIPTWTNDKMILFYDYDALGANDFTRDPCSELVIESGRTETRSFTHLEASATRVRTFTPTWDTNVIGNFSISSQYVYDLADYAAEVYGL